MLKVKQIIPREVCLRCQGCCRFLSPKTTWSPRLLDEERYKLGSHRKNLRLLSSPLAGMFICQYFDWHKNKCRIYSHRPFDCRLYPFLLSREGKKVFLAIDLNCPFAQKNLKTEKLKKYVRYLNAFLKSLKVRSVLKRNPQLIQRYKEALRLLELRI